LKEKKRIEILDLNSIFEISGPINCRILKILDPEIFKLIKFMGSETDVSKRFMALFYSCFSLFLFLKMNNGNVQVSGRPI
jgi:hypothetical protein